MTEDKIQQAFEGRWRIKGCEKKLNDLWAKDELYPSDVEQLCLDFFKTGIRIGILNNENDTYGIVQGGIVSEDELVYVDTFDDFWNSYDKKVGRPKCEKLWEKLTTKERKNCLDYIPLYKKAQPEKQYRKNPETFLRNKSWNDELIYRDNGTDIKEQQRQQRLRESAELVAKYARVSTGDKE